MAPHTVLFFTSFLALGIVDASSNAVVERSHPRDLQKRAEVDCGTWVMQCAGASGGDRRSIENACNNACYYQKYIRGEEYVATFTTEDLSAHNRWHSGCNVGDNKNSVCRLMPYSQKMAEGFNLADPTCDEFPMADWKQDDFVNGKGVPRNALRCMERGENGAAGGQWLAFKTGTGDHPKRTCSGDMNQANTDYKFKIEMNLDGADQSLLGYCQQNAPTNIDSGEFWMDHLEFEHGDVSFPLDVTKNNQYSTGANFNDKFQAAAIMQCRVVVFRQTNVDYSATFYEADGTKLGEGEKQLNNDGDKLVLEPTGSTLSYTKLSIIRTGEMGQAGTKGSRVDFVSSFGDDYSNPLTDFKFTTESTGWDTRFKKVEGSNPEKGWYCDVEDIKDGENGPTQSMTCWYPCTF